MGSILCRGSHTSTTAIDDTDSATLLPRASSKTRKSKTSCDKRSGDTFHLSHERISACDRGGQLSGKQRGRSVPFLRNSQAETSPGPSKEQHRANQTTQKSARQSSSLATLVSNKDTIMDDKIPLIEAKKYNSSDDHGAAVKLSSSPTKERAKVTASMERPRQDTIIEMAGTKHCSVQSKASSKEVKRVTNPQRSNRTTQSAETKHGGKSSSTARRDARSSSKRSREKKRRASSSPVVTDSSNIQDIRTRAKAEVVPFFSDESTISSACSNPVDGNTTRPSQNLDDSKGEATAKETNESVADMPKKQAPARDVATTKERPAVFRPFPETVTRHPTRSGLRAEAPIFVPKPVLNPSMGYPNSFTQAHAHPVHPTSNHPRFHAPRIVRLQGGLNPGDPELPLLPLLGTPDPSQRLGPEMHHWSPTSSSAFRIPHFSSREPAKPAPGASTSGRSKHARADQTTRQSKHVEAQRPGHAANGGLANLANGEDKSLKHALKAMSRVARKDPQASGQVAVVSGLAMGSSQPRVFHYRGTKVTMIDEYRKVFVIDLLPKETCDLIRSVSNFPVFDRFMSNPGRKF